MLPQVCGKPEVWSSLKQRLRRQKERAASLGSAGLGRGYAAQPKAAARAKPALQKSPAQVMQLQDKGMLHSVRMGRGPGASWPLGQKQYVAQGVRRGLQAAAVEFRSRDLESLIPPPTQIPRLHVTVHVMVAWSFRFM